MAVVTVPYVSVFVGNVPPGKYMQVFTIKNLRLVQEINDITTTCEVCNNF